MVWSTRSIAGSAKERNRLSYEVGKKIETFFAQTIYPARGQDAIYV